MYSNLRLRLGTISCMCAHMLYDLQVRLDTKFYLCANTFMCADMLHDLRLGPVHVCILPCYMTCDYMTCDCALPLDVAG